MTTKAKRTTKTEAKARPALHIRVGGVRIPIWENEGEDGKYFKAGQPELSYKGSDDQWHTGTSYGPKDLVNLIKAAALAHSELIKRIQSKPEADDAAEPE